MAIKRTVDPDEVIDTITINRQGRFSIPERFRDDCTVRTPMQTEVHRGGGATHYDGDNPWLWDDEDGVMYVQFEPHGADERFVYRLEPFDP